MLLKRMTRDERVDRDLTIYRLHLAGVSYRSIAKRVGLTSAGVHKIVRRELDRAAEVRDDLVPEAEIEHLERMKQLYAVYAPKAQAGDLKAAEYCRRLLADMARIKGLNQSVAERLPAARDDDLDPARGDDQPLNDLEAWRLKRVGIAVADDGEFVETADFNGVEDRGRSRAELIRDADRALNA